MQKDKPLSNWSDWESTILYIGKSLGIYDESIELNDVPRYIFWTNSLESSDIDAIQDVIKVLLRLGFLEMRDDEDLEYRINPDFRIKWHLLSSGNLSPETLPTRPSALK